MIDYQPEMDPADELYSPEEQGFNKERVAEWRDVRAGVPHDEDRVSALKDSLRRGVEQAGAGEVREVPEVTMPYEEVAGRREFVEAQLDQLWQVREHVAERYWKAHREQSQKADESLRLSIEIAGLDGMIDDLKTDLGFLSNRECESCGGQGGGHVHECPTQPTSACGCC